MPVLRGRLVDYSNRQPIKWLAVFLNGYNGASDDNGYFAITAPAGRYRLMVRALTYRPYTRDDVSLPEEGLDIGEIELYRAWV